MADGDADREGDGAGGCVAEGVGDGSGAVEGVVVGEDFVAAVVVGVRAEGVCALLEVGVALVAIVAVLGEVLVLGVRVVAGAAAEVSCELVWAAPSD